MLWIDCAAGLLVGGVMLALNDWLSRLYALPLEVVLFVGAANFLYACYSLSLASRETRSRKLITFLIVANLAWPIVCVTLLCYFLRSVSIFGAAHLAAEAIFVGGLALLEWKFRDQLVVRGAGASGPRA